MNIYRGIGRGRTYQADIPQLNGGLVTTQAAHNIEDHQLADGCNVWFHDGMLRTRPGFQSPELTERFSVQDNAYRLRRVDSVVSDLVSFVREGAAQTARLFIGLYHQVPQVNSAGLSPKSQVFFSYVDGKGQPGALPSLTVTYDSVGQAPRSVLVQEDDQGLWLLVHGQGIYRLAPEATAWVKLTDADFYAPLVMVNVRPLERAFLERGTAALSEADLWEGYSLLTNRVRLWMTSDGTGDGWKPPLPAGLKTGSTLTAVYTDSQGTEHTHTLTVGDGKVSYESAAQDDGFKLAAYRSPCILFLAEQDETDGSIRPVKLPDTGLVNNIRVELTLDGETQADKVYGMTCGAWFGGQASGISGGTRLFLGGSDADKALVLWSDLNNPLYFSENNYAYVGDKNQQVTAFGKQSDMLVIFKQRELFYTRYVEGTQLTTQAVTEGAVVDVTTTPAVFPMIQLHAEIGCRCPGTIQLCGNRLVWADGSATSGGRVYTLTAANAYSERNVFPVSGAIADRLRGLDLTAACAADWQGQYLLGVGNQVFLLDYDTYGFAYVSSYTYRDHAQKRMAWHVWKLAIGTLGALGVQDGRLLARLDRIDEGYPDDPVNATPIRAADGLFEAKDGVPDMYVVVGDSSAQPLAVAVPVDCWVETKHFGMGSGQTLASACRRKAWGPLYIGFVGDGDLPVTAELSFIGDGKRGGVRRIGSRQDKCLRVQPPSGPAARLGLRLTWQGAAALDGLTLHYTTIGSVR